MEKIDPDFSAIDIILSIMPEEENGYNIVKKYHENGELMAEARFIDGQLQKHSRVYFETGKISAELNFHNGSLNGKSTWYYENGKKKMTRFFKNGKLDGISFIFDMEGKVIEEQIYIEDTLMKKIRYGKDRK